MPTLLQHQLRGNKLDLKGKKVWFTSDYHLFHENVIKFDNRPFSSIEEMHRVIRENHNSVVGQEDIVVYLGDLAFTSNPQLALKFLESLNGTFILVRGNHDKLLQEYAFRNSSLLILDLLEITMGPTDHFICCHYPLLVWNRSHHGSFHVFGHVHGHLPEQPGRSMDVGIMNNNFFPFSAEEVKQKLLKKQPYAPDVHRSINRKEGKNV